MWECQNGNSYFGHLKSKMKVSLGAIYYRTDRDNHVSEHIRFQHERTGSYPLQTTGAFHLTSGAVLGLWGLSGG